MTTAYIDLKDPSRAEVGQRALTARMTLEAARRVLDGAGYKQIRFDQWQHPKTRTLVETGYTYGEARLVVHEFRPNYVSPVVTDFRMVGGETNSERYAEFKKRAGVPKHA